jgi:tripartite-type tricarboxylate transporter receptor subunit TctC
MLRLIVAISCTLGVFWSDGVAAQDYPTRPIRLIVGYGAGGATDLAARIVADHMEKTLGQPITVENRPGGNGTVGTRAVSMAAPDSYTLGMTSGSILTVLPWTMYKSGPQIRDAAAKVATGCSARASWPLSSFRQRWTRCPAS